MTRRRPINPGQDTPAHEIVKQLIQGAGLLPGRYVFTKTDRLTTTVRNPRTRRTFTVHYLEGKDEYVATCGQEGQPPAAPFACHVDTMLEAAAEHMADPKPAGKCEHRNDPATCTWCALARRKEAA